MLVPGAILDPGAHWAYQAGYTSCLIDVGHYTVGRNSIALIRDQGLCSLLARDEGLYQFAPVDALTYTQCEFNPRATGTEVESLDGSMTPGTYDAFAYVTVWKGATLGIPPDVYADGPRLPIGTDFRGHTNHSQLEHRACDQHYDGFPPEVWAQILNGGAPAPATPTGGTMHYVVINGPAPGNPRTFTADDLLITGELDYGDTDRGAFGIHNKALKSGLPIVNGEVPLLFDDGGPRAIERYIAYVKAGGLGTGGGTSTPCPDCPPGLDDATNDQVLAELADRLVP